MKKLYEKNKLTFAIVWIVIYCVLQSLANPLNEIIGIEYSASAVFCILQTIVLLGFIRKNGLPHRVHALRWISGGSDFQGASVCFYCKG